MTLFFVPHVIPQRQQTYVYREGKGLFMSLLKPHPEIRDANLKCALWCFLLAEVEFEFTA